MNKICRKNTDVRIFFKSKMRQVQYKLSANLPHSINTDRPKKNFFVNLNYKFKNIISIILRFLYKALVKILRPFNFRIKRYFLGNIEQQQKVISQKMDLLLNLANNFQLLANKNTVSNIFLSESKKNSDNIIIIGAGGHAKVCVELFQLMGKQVDYCIGITDSPDFCNNIPVLKNPDALSELRKKNYKHIFIAIGNNQRRQLLAQESLKEGYTLVNAISPHSVISESVVLGKGIAIMSGVVINAECRINDLVIINTGASIDHDCQIAKAVHIGPQCALAGNISIGAESFLGIGAKVIPDIHIGEKVIIGAGSTVISDIGHQSTAVGVPAKIIKHNN